MNSKGFSTIELVIATGITSVIVAASISALMMVSSKASESDARMQMEITSLDIKNALSDRGTCTQNLKGLTLKLDAPDGTNVRSLDLYDQNGIPTRNLLAVGGGEKALQITSIRIRPVGNIYGRAIASELTINAKIGGLSMAPRKFSVISKTINDNISECIGIGDISVNAAMICEANDMQYDPSSKGCISRPGKWVFGTPTKATCDAGWMATPRSSWPCGCFSPDSFQDTFGVTRTYQNSGSMSGGAPPALSDYNSSGQYCSCNYATDIDTTGWQAGIYCEPMGANNSLQAGP